MTYSIVAEGLVKRFGETVARAGVDLGVRTGSVLGLLGPTGAGKTTAVRILATLVRPDAGHSRSVRRAVVTSWPGCGARQDEQRAQPGPADLQHATGAGPDLKRPQHRYPHKANSARCGGHRRNAQGPAAIAPAAWAAVTPCDRRLHDPGDHEPSVRN
jgi:energy-coupling factor transporter ATP-binding protein EcfA2